MGSQEHVRTQIAQRLDHLFAITKRPDGRKKTNEELADHITAYTGKPCRRVWVSRLRKGEVDVSASRLEAIADFFKVNVSYFTDPEVAKVVDAEMDVAVALRQLEANGLQLRQLTQLHPDDAPLVAAMLERLIKGRHESPTDDGA